MSSLFTLAGWETISSLVRGAVDKDADWAFAFVHWFLVHKAQLGCLGAGMPIGSTAQRPQYADSSELLPAGWNARSNSYALRYISPGDGTVYTVMGSISEDVIIVKVLSSSKMKLSSVQLHIGDTADTLAGCAGAKAATPAAQLLIERLVRELLNPVFRSHLQSSETQTIPDRLLLLNRQQNSVERNSGSEFCGDDRCPAAPGRRVAGNRGCAAPVVVRNDLDPLAAARRDRIDISNGNGVRAPCNNGGGGGGGMLYQLPKEMPPVQPDSLQMHSVVSPPAGARFDPFGPPGVGSRDNFRLPKFGDRFPD